MTELINLSEMSVYQLARSQNLTIEPGDESVIKFHTAYCLIDKIHLFIIQPQIKRKITEQTAGEVGVHFI